MCGTADDVHNLTDEMLQLTDTELIAHCHTKGANNATI